jgi:hypothetical protein
MADHVLAQIDYPSIAKPRDAAWRKLKKLSHRRAKLWNERDA